MPNYPLMASNFNWEDFDIIVAQGGNHETLIRWCRQLATAQGIERVAAVMPDDGFEARANAFTGASFVKGSPRKARTAYPSAASIHPSSPGRKSRKGAVVA